MIPGMRRVAPPLRMDGNRYEGRSGDGSGRKLVTPTSVELLCQASSRRP